ncbi:DUF2207 domain-containing protein [Bacillus daqingensis]|nr:DUF2207 domain-containing protein [Alkalicoccus luteus]
MQPVKHQLIDIILFFIAAVLVFGILFDMAGFGIGTVGLIIVSIITAVVIVYGKAALGKEA